MAVDSAVLAGAVLFSRFAYPPDEIGRTDEDRARDLADDGSHFNAMGRLGTLARGYESALPYLELIAQAANIAHPLDARVVEAYWIGSSLLEAVDREAMTRYVQERALAGGGDIRGEPAVELLRPHHNVHVLGATPWVGLHRTSDAPMEALDQCRIRWGRVLSVDGRVATVRSRPLGRSDGQLVLGEARLEHVHLRPGAPTDAPRVQRGDWCAMHWDWVCDRLSMRQLVQLRRMTRMQLDAINAVE